VRVFIYLRVSTDDQEDNTSLEQQEKDCREYCDINGHSVVGVYKNVYTGSVWRERKGFMEMRARYLRGEASGLVIRTYSRFTRIIAHYYVLTEEMREYNVKLLCVKEVYDDTVIGRMLQGIQMGFNEQERETTRQRMMDGKRARVENRQQYLAARKPPYGYQFNDPVKKSKLIINEEEAEVVRWIIEQRAESKAYNRIARELIEKDIPSPAGKIWSKRAIERIIDNCKYLYRGIGVAFQTRDTKEYREGKLVHVRIANNEEDMLLLPDGVVERMVSDELAFKALAVGEAMKQDNPRANPDPEAALLRGGFIKCGRCGYTMVTVKMARYPVPYYECNGQRNAHKICVSNTITVPVIDHEIWNYAVEVAKNISILETAVTKVIGVDTLASAEKSTLQCIADCDSHIAQYQEDLRKKEWKPATRAFLLEEMEKQFEAKKSLELELENIRTGRVDHKRLEEELQALIAWCKRVKLGEDTEPSWKEKRDHLRALGIVVYVWPTRDMERERYEIRVAPKGLLDVLNGEMKELSATHLH
jgi:site-specific DNA recombinase